MVARTENERKAMEKHSEPGNKAAREGGILFPDADLDIGGETVTVKEFTFAQTLKLERIAKPIIDDLAKFGDQWEGLNYTDVAMVFADHDEAFMTMMALSIGKPVEWIANLGGNDGNALAMTFWSVNSSFFVQRLLTILVQSRMKMNKEKNASDGAASSQP